MSLSVSPSVCLSVFVCPYVPLYVCLSVCLPVCLQSCESLRKFAVTEPDKEFALAKKAVVHKTAPEIVSTITGANVELAAGISEFIVDMTLEKLAECSAKLVRTFAR